MTELLVVIGLLGILSVTGLASYTGSQQNGRDGRRRADLETLRQSLELYNNDTGDYPVQTGEVEDLMTPLVPTYISSVNFPQDPKTDRYYYYEGSTTTYNLCAWLESKKATDPGCPNAAAECSGAGDLCNYGVTQP